MNQNNTVTNPGSNEFHGSAFGYFTNNNFSSSPRISFGQPPEGNYTNFDFGFGIGGPLIRDRLWYYLTYDPSRESEDVYAEGLNMQNSYSIKHKLAGKLTWSADDNNLITLSMSGSPSTARNVYSSNRTGVIMTDLLKRMTVQTFGEMQQTNLQFLKE